MRIALFYHSLVSDWNHGNAHFLRGIAAELLARGNEVVVYEPANGWSRQNLLASYGEEAIQEFEERFPLLRSLEYNLDTFDLDRALDGVDLVLVHEWNEHSLVRQIGAHRAGRGSYRLLFHDTHHRSVTDPESMSRYDLSGYDGVLAYGEAVRQVYLKRGWARQVWTWHEAADTRVFHPVPESRNIGDAVWIGNWGDEERTTELFEFLADPVAELGLRARVYGVRYPDEGIRALRERGIEYGGWLPNYRVPNVFGEFKFTVHIPRAPYVRALPGIPTIRPFEALACGIPLISAPWDDVEGLFTPGKDFLIARNGAEMWQHMRAVLNGPDLAQELSRTGLATIQSRHTCAHRIDELMRIYSELSGHCAAACLEQASAL